MNVYYEKCHYEMMTMKSVTMKPYTASKKRGRKKKETLPKALEKSPDVAKKQNLRRSQRSKK